MLSQSRRPLISLVLFTLALSGCDGYLELEGQIYHWIEAPQGAKSYALVDEPDADLPPSVVALEGARILMEPWTPEEREKMADNRSWTDHAKSDSSGHFQAGSVQAPWWFDATITVTCDGYQTVEKVFHHNRFDHTVIVVLVPED